ncbi:hypothetical protein M3699_24910 [Peribacillus simplex]|uniref:hypothetical protein n=1 Tax=Peribacillus simplex TaxID=1478 RepID=UPI00203E79B5|nr:hypothetical protein [Peribacillus simplex]MCM3676972.1 hypothetical protein [Peribacillus simplex]
MENVITILGVGSLFLFHQIDITLSDTIMLMAIIQFSLFIMRCSEFIVYQKDVKPLKQAMEQMNPSLLSLQTAYTTAQKFPLLVCRQTLIVHFMATILVILFIYWEKLNSGTLVLLGLIVSVFTSVMHALIDFFLSMKTVRPIISELSKRAGTLYGENGKLQSNVFIGIQTKLLASSIFLDFFPIPLFSLLLTVILDVRAVSFLGEFSVTPGLFFFIILLIVIGGVYLLADHALASIHTLKKGRSTFQKGKFHALDHRKYNMGRELLKLFNVTPTTTTKNQG